MSALYTIKRGDCAGGVILLRNLGFVSNIKPIQEWRDGEEFYSGQHEFIAGNDWVVFDSREDAEAERADLLAAIHALEW